MRDGGRGDVMLLVGWWCCHRFCCRCFAVTVLLSLSPSSAAVVALLAPGLGTLRLRSDGEGGCSDLGVGS